MQDTPRKPALEQRGLSPARAFASCFAAQPPPPKHTRSSSLGCRSATTTRFYLRPTAARIASSPTLPYNDVGWSLGARSQPGDRVTQARSLFIFTASLDTLQSILTRVLDAPARHVTPPSGSASAQLQHSALH